MPAFGDRISAQDYSAMAGKGVLKVDFLV